MTYKVIILRYRTDGYQATGQCLATGQTEETANLKAKEYNHIKPGQEGLGPQSPKDGGTFAVAVPEELES